MIISAQSCIILTTKFHERSIHVSMLAIITARGGSKRIPKKNIKPFAGKPIIHYAIEAALNSGIFDEVMVSTDSEEIAEVARQGGASVPFMRSEKTANDFATTRDVLLEVIDCYAKMGKHFDSICCIYPTNPFITADKLKRAGETFAASGAEGMTPVVAFSYPPQRGFYIQDNKLEWVQPEHYATRSQDLPTIYHDVGQFYFYNVKAYMRPGFSTNSNIVPFVISEKEAQDIDTAEDWEMAEMKYELLKRTER